MGWAVTLAPFGHPKNIARGLDTLSPNVKGPVGWVGGTHASVSFTPGARRGWAAGPFLSSVPCSSVALLGGLAGSGPGGFWAGIADHRDSLDRGCGP